jgi:gamma-glutamylcyclotransferase (GGCT)/AIG2-like uncharacterized protein YtfP
MTHRVFVYGTLKKGFWNNPLLKGCEFFGSAVTVPTYSAAALENVGACFFSPRRRMSCPEGKLP